MRLEAVPTALAWGAFSSVCLAPFLFGSQERSIWIPLSQLWLGLGLASAFVQARLGTSRPGEAGPAVSRALLPIHGLFILQLIPLPALLLRILSPGSYAAHFLPDPGDGRFRPLSISPSSTIDAWLYFVGLQGLFLTLEAMPDAKRRRALYALLTVIVLLAAEGLWQSQTAHPSWLYSVVPNLVPSGFERASFGPYYNRNHFATVTAVGAGLAAGLAATVLRERPGFTWLLHDTRGLTRVIVLAGASTLLALTTAASGSRSGTLAAVSAIAFVSARALGARLSLLPLGLGLAALALSGAASVERLMRFNLVTSRLVPWMDMTRLFRFFPVFGSGLGTFWATYWPYQTNVTYEYWQHAHNEYLQWAVEGGLLGAVLLPWVILRLRRAVTFAPETKEAALAALAAFAVQALLDFPIRVPANAAVLFCALALSVRAREK